MTIRHLRIFCEVCRMQSMSLAAEKLNLAQPAVSTAIRELESYYQTRLFERMNRTIYLTESGRRLLDYARAILDQLEEAREVLLDLDTTYLLRLGANASYGQNALPGLVTRFRRQNPEIPVNIQIDNSSRIETALKKNALDFGIIDKPEDPSVFFCFPLAKEEIVLACAPSFPAPDEIRLSEMGQYPFLVREKGSGSRKIARRMAKRGGVELTPAAVSSNSECLIRLCLEGLGILILPRSLVQTYLDLGQMKEIRLSEKTFTRTYYLAYHKKKYLTGSMKRFLEYALDSAQAPG